MKKKALNNLTLVKSTISSFRVDEIQGGLIRKTQTCPNRTCPRPDPVPSW